MFMLGYEVCDVIKSRYEGVHKTCCCLSVISLKFPYSAICHIVSYV